MRVAIYGGSFNPPHIGHALVAAWVKWTDQADAVWLVPAYDHAFGKALVPFERRAAWCDALASTLGPWARTERIESELPPPSYTLNTLMALSQAHPEHRFRLVLGSDNLPHLDRWHRWEDIAAGFDPLVVGRVGYASPPDVPEFPGVSSTEIRRRALAGEPLEGLVPAAVLARISDEDRASWATAAPAR